MKKFLSIILALCMLVSLIPAVFASETAEQTELNYVFSHAAHKSSAGNGPASAGGNGTATLFSAVGFDDMDTAVSSGAWGNKDYRPTFAEQSIGTRSSALEVHKTGNIVNVTLRPIDVAQAEGNPKQEFYNCNSERTAGAAPIFMIALNVPTAGTYVPSLIANASGAVGQKYEVFLVDHEETEGLTPAQVRASLDVADRIGVYDSSVGGEQTFLEHYLPKGVYYLTLIPGGMGANSKESSIQNVFDETGKATTIKEIVIQLKSFKLAVPEKVEVEEYDPSKLHLSSSNTRYAKYEFETNSYNIANTITDGENTTWYFGDTWENIQAYATATGAIISSTDVYAKNTWTDQSETSKANNKFVSWFVNNADSGFSAALRETSAWYRNNGTVYMYHGNGGVWVDNYDYLNLANTDKWAPIGYYGNIVKTEFYTRVDNGIHMQISGDANLKKLGEGNDYIVLKVNVPTAAKYTARFDHQSANTTGRSHAFAAYMLPASETLPTTYAERAPYYICGGGFGSGVTSGTFNALKAGDYYLILEVYRLDTTTCPSTNRYDIDIHRLVLTAQGDPEIPEVPVDPELAEKRAAMVLDEGNPDAEAVSAGAATVNVLARAIDEDDHEIDDVIDTVANVATGADYTTEEAPEIPGYKFLYWGVGLGTDMRVVSTEETATIKAAKGANYVYAFYSKDDAEDVTVEFYNANRELVKRTPYQAGDEIEIPELPSLTGVGDAIGWSMDGGKKLVDTDDVIEAEGSIMAFFAVYDEEDIAENIEITATGSTGITGEGTYAFGDVVTLKAPARENGNGYNMFLYWKKNGEIVSFDREYTFNAAVTCEVEAVYAKYGPTTVEALRKILVSNVGDAVVAEFIGCENALERGFIFGDLRQPMMTDAESFTMINDTTSTPKAYAIFSDGVIFSK